ncbi:MAG TPA: ATP-binding protein [Vicinamibacterales bacterium]|nr:ATP-binding protein [Vicinamibacterales bacterium]
MKPLASLTNRIFLAAAMLAVLSVAAAIYIVNAAVTEQAEGELRRGLDEAGILLDENRTVLFDHFKREARLIADLPVLKAAVSETDAATVRPIAADYRQQLSADLFVVTNRDGRLLARIGDSDVADEALPSTPAVMQALAGREIVSFWPVQHGILQVVSVPIWIDRAHPEILGTLSVGTSLDDRLASRFKALTNSEVVFGVSGAIQAGTLPAGTWTALAPLLGQAGRSGNVELEGNDYAWVARPLAATTGPGQPTALILRSRTERLRFLRALHARLGLTALLAVLAATLLSYGIARTVTRPLGTITTTMREMAATGDLTRRIPVPAEQGWQDEDARLLATTFNTMTSSIERFQREAAQRERLSSLGRLSTIVAHEIRNPLMIIKAALRGLRREDVRPDQVAGAVHDIDEEITRLNRIVTEVLDFARPIAFDLAPADLNALARDAVRAAGAGGARPDVRLDLDPALPAAVIDAERVRQALVNIVGNAVQAVESRGEGAPPDAVRLMTRRIDDHRAAIVVSDKGPGIAPEDLPRVFEPFFTTRRTGTGIGLAISRNIIEGLGGRITVSSHVGRGTEVRIELPLQSAPVL